MKSKSRVFLESQVRKALHRVLRLSSASSPQPITEPSRILLLNGAHLGDLVISTSLLPVIKSAYPKAQIGFATGRWSQPVIRNHPLVDFIHTIDHWIMNREDKGRFRKRYRHWKTRSQALSEIRDHKYDIAICLHPWRPDLLPVAWQARIPTRVAFSRSIFAPLATRTAEYPEDMRLVHQGECQARLLRSLGIAENHFAVRQSSLPPSSPDDLREVYNLLGMPAHQHLRYTIIHLGSGALAREVPLTAWREIASRLVVGGTVLFTGRGKREAEQIARLTAGLPNCVDASDKLSWAGFVAAVRHAEVLYGVESMSSHVAAAVGTPCVALYSGINNVARWRPYGQNCTVWSNAVSCSPCGRFHGCQHMSCMDGFNAADIVQLAKPLVKTAGGAA